MSLDSEVDLIVPITPIDSAAGTVNIVIAITTSDNIHGGISKDTIATISTIEEGLAGAEVLDKVIVGSSVNDGGAFTDDPRVIVTRSEDDEVGLCCTVRRDCS